MHSDNYSVQGNVITKSFMKTGYAFDATSTVFTGSAAERLLLISHYQKRLEHASITDEDQLFEECHTILRSIPGEELERVFEAWRERVQNVN
jgi:hypothetical protein